MWKCNEWHRYPSSPGGVRWWKWTWKYFMRQNHYWHHFYCHNGSSNLLQTSPILVYCTVRLARWLCRPAANVSSAITSNCLRSGTQRNIYFSFFFLPASANSNAASIRHGRRNHHTMHKLFIHWRREHHGCLNAPEVEQMGCHKTNQLAICDNKNQYFGTMQNVKSIITLFYCFPWTLWNILVHSVQSH